MYVPPHARETRLEILHQAIAEIVFGTLVTVSDQAPMITHLPMMIRAMGEAGMVVGHVSRANPQWRTANPNAVATFTGPSFYVSPAWYAKKQIDGKVVPTYNYIAVEARGAITFFDDRGRLRQLVDELTAQHEAVMPKPWSSADAPTAFIAAQLDGIIGFELLLTEITGAWKLSRNKDAADRAGVADGIAASEYSDVRALADRVRAGSGP